MNIWEKNYRALKPLLNIETAVFTKPGFERNKERYLEDKNLNNCLKIEDYQYPNARFSIKTKWDLNKLSVSKQTKFGNLINLEHAAYYQTLLGYGIHTRSHAKLWWQKQPFWCAELQRRQAFRRSAPEQTWLRRLNANGQWQWCYRDEYEFAKIHILEKGRIQDIKIEPSQGNGFWFENKEEERYQDISEVLQMTQQQVAYIFGEVSVTDYSYGTVEKRYFYHPKLGIFKQS